MFQPSRDIANRSKTETGDRWICRAIGKVVRLTWLEAALDREDLAVQVPLRARDRRAHQLRHGGPHGELAVGTVGISRRIFGEVIDVEVARSRIQHERGMRDSGER